MHSHATTHSTLNTSATVTPFPCTATLQHTVHSIHPLPSSRSRSPLGYNTQYTQYFPYRHPVPVHSHATTHSTLKTSTTVTPFPCTATLQHTVHSIHPLPSPRSCSPPGYNTQYTQYFRYRHPVPVHRHATTHGTINTTATVTPFPCTATLQHTVHSKHPQPSPRSRAPPRYNTQYTQSLYTQSLHINLHEAF